MPHMHNVSSLSHSSQIREAIKKQSWQGPYHLTYSVSTRLGSAPGSQTPSLVTPAFQHFQNAINILDYSPLIFRHPKIKRFS